ncbi:hypothetical protein AU189_15740 [Mycolicibacterium acapulense]|nr:hypothetical protein AU189_15740 [Mycolicibacterium acapulense]
MFPVEHLPLTPLQIGPRGGRYSRPFTSAFDPAQDAFEAYSLPLLSVDEAGRANGAMVFDFTTSV